MINGVQLATPSAVRKDTRAEITALIIFIVFSENIMIKVLKVKNKNYTCATNVRRTNGHVHSCLKAWKYVNRPAL